jgi:hypothetical protein
MKLFDRYSLFCISVSLIILIAALTNAEEPAPEPEDEPIIGIVFDIKSSQSGFTFTIEDTKGIKTRCFARAEPAEFGVYAVKGDFSDDGSMLFVSDMEAALQNELYFT